MSAKLGSLVRAAASSFGIEVDGTAEASIDAWLCRLDEWNARMDLTAARTREELVDLMIVDALVLAAHVPRTLEVVDVGTGAGGPGLALAIFRRDLRVALVEPRIKRVSFLRAVIDEIGRSDIAVEHGRGESLVRRRRWQVAVSRATLRPAAWLDLGVKLVSPGGTVWVLLAKEQPPHHAAAVVETDIAYEWPLTGARRRAVAYRLR